MHCDIHAHTHARTEGGGGGEEKEEERCEWRVSQEKAVTVSESSHA